jgi:hypothetical protein
MGAQNVFAMADRFEPSEDIHRFVSGTPPVTAMLAIEAMLDLVEQAGIDAIRRKSGALTRFAAELLAERVLPLGAELASPVDGRRRGSHLVVTHPAFRAITATLWERGIIPDFRSPDGIRIGLSPLSTTPTIHDLRRGRDRHPCPRRRVAHRYRGVGPAGRAVAQPSRADATCGRNRAGQRGPQISEGQPIVGRWPRRSLSIRT